MRLLPATVIAVSLIWTVHQPVLREPQPPDLIVHNANVYTMNEAQPTANALAVRGERFVAIGGSDEVLRLRGGATRVIDAQRATIVPGFQDAHGHVAGLGESLQELDLKGTTSFEIIVDRVRARAATAKPGTWIVGRGWDQNRWPVRDWPAPGALDAASGDHPVLLIRVDGHAALANRLALRAAGVDRDTPDPAGGRLIRDASGEPTGVLIDNARALVERSVPAPSRDEIRERLLAADRELRRVGLTMVHDAGVPPAVIEIYRELVGSDRFETRAYVMLTGLNTGDWLTRGPLLDPHHRLTVRAVKLVADGALGSRGAALLEDYTDEPGNRGLLVTPPKRIYAVTRAASQAGFQTAVHAIGDRANREVLDIFERVEREVPRARELRLRDEHAQILDQSDIPRFAHLGVIASIQSTHCTSDMPWAPSRLGPARVKEGAYVWQKLLASGARLAQGSDFPVERPDPLLGFYAAITRQDTDGRPPGGWAPDQRLSRQEALGAATLGAAYAAHAERDLGSIEPGKLADFVVLSRDIMQVAPAEVLTTTITRTVIAGRTVYQAD
jgi:predicted amidohydrolase YtcJ